MTWVEEQAEKNRKQRARERTIFHIFILTLAATPYLILYLIGIVLH
jgi:hypothetical protein